LRGGRGSKRGFDAGDSRKLEKRGPGPARGIFFWVRVRGRREVGEGVSQKKGNLRKGSVKGAQWGKAYLVTIHLSRARKEKERFSRSLNPGPLEEMRKRTGNINGKKKPTPGWYLSRGREKEGSNIHLNWKLKK